MNNVWRLALACAALAIPITGASAVVVVDQSNTQYVHGFSFLNYGTTAQTFVAGASNSVGAGIFLSPDYSSAPGTVSLSLWTNAPGAGSTMLASSSAAGVAGQWADATWSQVALTVGDTYHLRASADQSLVVGYGGNYAGGNTYYDFGGSGFSNFSGYDLNFRTLTQTDAISAVPEPATWAMMLIGFGGIGSSMRRTRRKSFAVLKAA